MYLLVSSYNRELFAEKCDSLWDAQNKMEAQYNYIKGNDRYVGDYYAWVNEDEYYDWKIIELED